MTSICVIGAGLAGGIVASKLAAIGYRVTLIEQGQAPGPDIPEDEDWEGADLRSLFTRGQGIGGSSNFWHGGLIALDPSDIEGRSPHGGGPKFPISHAHLCHYYRSALEVMADRYVSLDDLVPETMEVDGIPLDRTDFRLKPMFFPRSPYSTKGIVQAAERERGLRVISGFRAERLTFSESSEVEAVEGVVSDGGGRTKVAADVFVICAGGVGSPKILLRSAAGSARLSELPVGRSLIDHPTGFVFKARLRRRMNLRSLFGEVQQRDNPFRRRLGFVLREERLEIAGDRNHALYLRPAFSLRDPTAYSTLKSKLVAHRGRKLRPGDILELLRHGDLLAEAVNFRFGLLTSVRYVAGFVFAEQMDFRDNAITLGSDQRFRIRWDIAPDDSASLTRFLEAFKSRHDGMFENVALFPQLLGSGAHHSGGCRMAANPSSGVVGRDLRVFGVSNLFVADGSVLGYSGHANTGLTIVAMALKCVDEVHKAHASKITDH